MFGLREWRDLNLEYHSLEEIKATFLVALTISENNAYMQQVKSILDKNEKDIITACQNYLQEFCVFQPSARVRWSYS